MDGDYFSSLAYTVQGALEENASQMEHVALTRKVLQEMVDHEWITFFEPLSSEDWPLHISLPKEELVDHVMELWEAIGYRELLPWDVIWYEATPKGLNYLDAEWTEQQAQGTDAPWKPAKHVPRSTIYHHAVQSPNAITQPIITIRTYKDFKSARSAASSYFSKAEKGDDIRYGGMGGSSTFKSAVIGDTRLTLRYFSSTYPPHPTDGTPAATITLQRNGEKHPIILKFNY